MIVVLECRWKNRMIKGALKMWANDREIWRYWEVNEVSVDGCHSTHHIVSSPISFPPLAHCAHPLCCQQCWHTPNVTLCGIFLRCVTKHIAPWIFLSLRLFLSAVYILIFYPFICCVVKLCFMSLIGWNIVKNAKRNRSEHNRFF